MIDFAGIAMTSLVVGLLQAGGVLALGAGFRLMRFPDITVEGSFLIGAAIWAGLVRTGLDTGAATVIAAAAGGICGITTAFLHGLFRIDRFLAGILVTAACYSLGLLALGASNVGLFDAPSPFNASISLAATPYGVALAFAGVLGLLVLAFFRSTVGLRARAAAANPAMFEKTVGRPTPYVAVGLAFTNAIAALSGLMFARYQGFVDIGMGQGVLITALAALAVGEAATSWLRVPMIVVVIASAFAGSILYQAALSTALAVGAPAATTKLVTALIVLLFLALQVRRRSLVGPV